jgi:hypothetical protein
MKVNEVMYIKDQDEMSEKLSKVKNKGNTIVKTTKSDDTPLHINYFLKQEKKKSMCTEKATLTKVMDEKGR